MELGITPDRDLFSIEFWIENRPIPIPSLLQNLMIEKNMTLFHFIGLTRPQAFVDLLGKVPIPGSFIVNISEET